MAFRHSACESGDVAKAQGTCWRSHLKENQHPECTRPNAHARMHTLVTELFGVCHRLADL
ncbi:MAG: hypothetical protein AAFO06_13810 [Cyanobacteria bacterium J06597_16]